MDAHINVCVYTTARKYVDVEIETHTQLNEYEI